MTRFRLAVWPLAVAAVFLVATILGAVLLPGIDPTLTINGIVIVDNVDLITLALGGLTLIFAALSFLLRKGPIDDDDAAFTINKVKEPKSSIFSRQDTPQDLMAAYQAQVIPVDEPQTDRVSARAADEEQKALTKEEKARAAAAAKFQKKAQKDAARAEKLAAKANKKGKKLADDVQVDEVSATAANEWISSIHEAFGVSDELEKADQDADEAPAERVIYELDEALIPEDSESTTPAWLTAAYEDPNFQIPFANKPEQDITEADAEAELAVAEEIVSDEVTVEIAEEQLAADEPEQDEQALEPVEPEADEDQPEVLDESIIETVLDSSDSDSNEDLVADDNETPADEDAPVDAITEAIAEEEDGWDIEPAAPAKKLGWFARRKAAKAAQAEEKKLAAEAAAAALAAEAEEAVELETIEDQPEEIEQDLSPETEAQLEDSEVLEEPDTQDQLDVTEPGEESADSPVADDEPKRGWFARKRGKHEYKPGEEDEAPSADPESTDEPAEVEEADQVPAADPESTDEPAEVEEADQVPVSTDAAATTTASKSKKKVRGARRKARKSVAEAVEDEVVAEAVEEELVAEAVEEELVAEAVVEELVAEAVVEELVAEAVEEELVAEAVVEELVAEAVAEELVAEAVVEELVAEAVETIEGELADIDDALAESPVPANLPFDDVYEVPSLTTVIETPEQDDYFIVATETDAEPAAEPAAPSFTELTEAEKVEAVYEQNRRLESELLELREQLALLIDANPRARRRARRNK